MFENGVFTLDFASESGNPQLIQRKRNLIRKLERDNFTLQIPDPSKSSLKLSIQKLRSLPVEDEARRLDLLLKLKTLGERRSSNAVVSLSMNDIVVFDTNMYLSQLERVRKTIIEFKITTLLPLVGIIYA
jgi:hypothetical protein